MYINIIGKFDQESFGSHIRDTLVKMGHEVKCIEIGQKYKQKNKFSYYSSRIYSRLNPVLEGIPLFQNIQRNNILRSVLSKSDLTIVTHDFLTPDVVKALKTITKGPVVLWFPDAIVNFRKAMFLDAEYDFLFFKDPYIFKVLNNDFKKNINYLPECCNPLIHNKVQISDSDKEKYGCDITTAGNLYTNRSAFFKQLSNSSYKIKIWGNPPALWMDTLSIKDLIMNKFIVGEEKGKAFSISKIVLNNLHPGEIAGLNCRSFEIPAYGGFQIVNWRPAIQELFTPDYEIVTFKNFDELTEKINFYLENDLKRIEIIENSYKRVHQSHTYEIRLNLLFETVFSGAKGYKTDYIIQ